MTDSTEQPNFNDDELADIMSEIDSLEKENTEDDEGAEVSATTVENEADPVEPVSAESEETPTEVAEEPSTPVENTEGLNFDDPEEVEENVPAQEVTAPVAKESAPDENMSDQIGVSEEEISDGPGLSSSGAENAIDHQEEAEKEMQRAKEEEEDIEMSQLADEMDDIQVEKVEQEELNTFSKDNVVPFPNQSKNKNTELEFNVKGQLDLSLSFVVGDQKVKLNVTENDGLTIEMPNGAKFVLPLQKGQILAKAH